MAKKQNVVYECIWAPHYGPQTEFLNDRITFELLFGGAKAGGKSEALVMKMIDPLYIRNERYRGLIVRRTYKRLLEIKDRCDFYYLKIDPGCYYNKDEHRYNFSNGAKIRLGHCEHEDDKWNYWGHEFHILGIDQVEELTETQYEIVRMSARSTVDGLKPQIRCTANPGVQWVKEYWIDVAPVGERFEFEMELPGGKKTILSRKFIPARIYDNPTLIDRDPQYVAVLQSIQDPKVRKQMLEGDWEVADGAAFEEFEKQIHVKMLSKLFGGIGRAPDGWTVFCTMDWGYSTPFAIYWHCLTPYDKIITFREYYGIKWDEVKRKFLSNVGIKMLAKDVAKNFLTRNADVKPDFMIADKSIWNRIGQESGSVGQEFELILAEKGIPMLKSDNSPGSRASKKTQTHNRLSIGKDGDPHWLIADCCVHLIRTLPTLLPVNKTNNPEEVDVLTSMEDHCLCGDTMVWTSEGHIPIKDIAGKSGFVMTVGGYYFPYSKCRKTQTNVDVVKVTLSDGRTVDCTPDHKFLCSNMQFKKAVDLKGQSLYKFFQKQSKSLTVPDTTNADVLNATGEKTATIGKQEFASSVEMSSRHTTSKRFRLAHEVVGSDTGRLTVLSVEPIGKDDVYCMEVDGTHCFAVNNGIIVHNCYDSVAMGFLQYPLVLETNVSELDRRIVNLDEYRRQISGFARENTGLPNAYTY